MINEGQGGGTKIYYAELVTLSHIRSHSQTPIHEADSAPDFERPAWWAQALCRDVSPTVADWFSTKGDDPLTDAAIRVCQTCPVQAECAAAGEREEFGIWGGIDPDERGRSRRVRRNESQRRLRAEHKGAA